MKRKRTFLSKLHTNGAYYIISGCILLLGIPLYQLLVLIPQGYSDALTSAGNANFTAYLAWIGNHTGQFISYRVLLIIAFTLLLSLPFTLFRIIVAQEILGREEIVEESEMKEAEKVDEEIDTETEDKEEQEPDGMPAFAWRGKGYAVIAAWAGFLGIMLFVLGTLASTIYLYIIGTSFTASVSQYLAATNCGSSCISLSSTFTIIANTVGSGLLALACLFFGAVIARSGRNLWPGIWVAFSYIALAIAALLSASAVEIASAPTAGQSVLTTPAILLFAIWALWLGIMLIRLKPE